MVGNDRTSIGTYVTAASTDTTVSGCITAAGTDSGIGWATNDNYTVRIDTTGATYNSDSTGAITIARNDLFEPYTVWTDGTNGTADTNVQFVIRREDENGDILLDTDSNVEYVYGGDVVWRDPPQFQDRGNPRRRGLQVTEGPEEKARRLLRRMVGDKVFRDYVKNGFLSYRAASGKVYQIFPGHRHMPVWKNGQQIEQLCVVFQDHKLPPTDAVVMRLLMLEHDEEGFRKMANVSQGFHQERIRWTPPKAEKGRILKLADEKKKGLIEIQGAKIKRKAASGYVTAGTSNSIIVAA
jgi:hypothetical protein